eukprot:jgi/Tetstr1/428830/TSEL_018817.t1
MGHLQDEESGGRRIHPAEAGHRDPQPLASLMSRKVEYCSPPVSLAELMATPAVAQLPPFNESFVSADSSEAPPIHLGSSAPMGRHPYTAYIAVPEANGGERIVCAGALVAPNAVLTAARCLGGTTVYIVREFEGQTDYEQLRVAGQTVHPAYNSYTDENDIMLYLLSAKSSQAPIRMDSGEQASALRSADLVSAVTWAPGLGRSAAWPLRYVNNTMCNIPYDNWVYPSMMCTVQAGGGPCQGFRGGPLILQGPRQGMDVLLGVSSWGFQCEMAGFPSVYSRLGAALPWIQATLHRWPGARLPMPCSEWEKSAASEAELEARKSARLFSVLGGEREEKPAAAGTAPPPLRREVAVESPVQQEAAPQAGSREQQRAERLWADSGAYEEDVYSNKVSSMYGYQREPASEAEQRGESRSAWAEGSETYYGAAQWPHYSSSPSASASYAGDTTTREPRSGFYGYQPAPTEGQPGDNTAESTWSEASQTYYGARSFSGDWSESDSAAESSAMTNPSESPSQGFAYVVTFVAHVPSYLLGKRRALMAGGALDELVADVAAAGSVPETAVTVLSASEDAGRGVVIELEVGFIGTPEAGADLLGFVGALTLRPDNVFTSFSAGSVTVSEVQVAQTSPDGALGAFDFTDFDVIFIPIEDDDPGSDPTPTPTPTPTPKPGPTPTTPRPPPPTADGTLVVDVVFRIDLSNTSARRRSLLQLLSDQQLAAFVTELAVAANVPTSSVAVLGVSGDATVVTINARVTFPSSSSVAEVGDFVALVTAQPAALFSSFATESISVLSVNITTVSAGNVMYGLSEVPVDLGALDADEHTPVSLYGLSSDMYGLYGLQPSSSDTFRLDDYVDDGQAVRLAPLYGLELYGLYGAPVARDPEAGSAKTARLQWEDDVFYGLNELYGLDGSLYGLEAPPLPPAPLPPAPTPTPEPPTPTPTATPESSSSDSSSSDSSSSESSSERSSEKSPKSPIFSYDYDSSDYYDDDSPTRSDYDDDDSSSAEDKDDDNTPKTSKRDKSDEDDSDDGKDDSDDDKKDDDSSDDDSDDDSSDDDSSDDDGSPRKRRRRRRDKDSSSEEEEKEEEEDKKSESEVAPGSPRPRSSRRGRSDSDEVEVPYLPLNETFPGLYPVETPSEDYDAPPAASPPPVVGWQPYGQPPTPASGAQPPPPLGVAYTPASGYPDAQIPSNSSVSEPTEPPAPAGEQGLPDQRKAGPVGVLPAPKDENPPPGGVAVPGAVPGFIPSPPDDGDPGSAPGPVLPGVDIPSSGSPVKPPRQPPGDDGPITVPTPSPPPTPEADPNVASRLRAPNPASKPSDPDGDSDEPSDIILPVLFDPNDRGRDGAGRADPGERSPAGNAVEVGGGEEVGDGDGAVPGFMAAGDRPLGDGNPHSTGVLSGLPAGGAAAASADSLWAAPRDRSGLADWEVALLVALLTGVPLLGLPASRSVFGCASSLQRRRRQQQPAGGDARARV